MTSRELRIQGGIHPHPPALPLLKLYKKMTSPQAHKSRDSSGPSSDTFLYPLLLSLV